MTARLLEPVLGTWDRAGAFHYLQRFHRFAEICGCDTPTNRSDVKKAVLFATMDVDLDTFIRKHNVSIKALESISRMECPVLEPDKTMQQVQESMPKRIIQSAKRMRVHFSLTETLTCRGCIKRKRCKWFRKAAQDGPAVCVSDVTKILFGLSQYCRYFLQNPVDYPPIAQDFAAPLELLDSLEAFVQENEVGNYADIPVADGKTSRQLMIQSAKEKMERYRKKREERILNLPSWMQESIVLTDHPKNLSERQKQALLAQADAKDDPTEWVAEGDEKNIAESEIKEIDDVRSIPLPKRFDYIERPEDRKAVEQYSTIYNQYVSGVYKTKKDPELNLDEVPEPATDVNQMGGGYTIVDMLDPRNFENIPAEVLDAVQVAPQALRGVHYYNTTGRIGKSSALFDKKVIEDMWSSSSNFDPPFLRRLPFDSPFMRSGGALPPSTLHALSDTHEQSRTPSSSSTTPVDPRLTSAECGLDAPEERVQVGPIFGRFSKNGDVVAESRADDPEDEDVDDSECERIFDDPWADIAPRRRKVLPAVASLESPSAKRESESAGDELIELPRRSEDKPVVEAHKNRISAPRDDLVPRTPSRGNYESLRRGLDEPGEKPTKFEFSRSVKGRAGLYFPGEDLPKRKVESAPVETSAESSAFPEVPKVRSRLRQAKLGNTRGLIREKEDEDSPNALQRMINKKLRERATK